MIRIAVSYKDGEIFEHFGHSEFFAIYEFDEHDLGVSTKRLVDCAGLHGHKDMAELLKREKADAVICGQMGDEARSLLLSCGVIPVPGYCGDADTAAELLVTGQLPSGDGGCCSGGCGGCSGCSGCGGDEDETDGGCGCGCAGDFSCGCGG